MAWTFVQSVQNSSASTSSLAITVSATGKDNLVVVNIKIGSTSITASVTDDKGNVYQLADGPRDSSPTRTYQFYAQQRVSGVTTVTIALSSSTSIRATADEFNAGTGMTGVFDKAATNSGSGTSSSVSLSPVNANELISVGVTFNSTVTTPVAGTDYVLAANNGNAATEYRLASTTSETGPMSWTTSVTWREIAGAYIATSARRNLLTMGMG